MAWFYRYYENELPVNVVEVYKLTETLARREKRGLWADPSPTPPWDFRRGKTTKAAGGPIIGNRKSKIYHMSNCLQQGFGAQPRAVQD
jgi:hypothetical protein